MITTLLRRCVAQCSQVGANLALDDLDRHVLPSGKYVQICALVIR